MSCHSMQGSDGVDLEMNLNGSKSTRDDDDDMDDIVSIFLFWICHKLLSIGFWHLGWISRQRFCA